MQNHGKMAKSLLTKTALSKNMTDLQIHLLTSEHDKHFGSFSLMLWQYIQELHTMDRVHVTLRTQSQLVQEYFHGISYANCYVLLDNNTCIGFAILGAKPNCHPDADIYIEEFYIDNMYRKKRIWHCICSHATG